MIDKINGPDGKVVYEHKAKPVQVYSPATATIMQSLMRGAQFWCNYESLNQGLVRVNGTLAGADWRCKTGTTNSNGDMWLMLSTSDDSWRLIGSRWQYFYGLALTGYNNNAAYMAYLANAIYEADPSLGNREVHPDSSVNVWCSLKSTEKTRNRHNQRSLYHPSGPTVLATGLRMALQRRAIALVSACIRCDYQKAWELSWVAIL